MLNDVGEINGYSDYLDMHLGWKELKRKKNLIIAIFLDVWIFAFKKKKKKKINKNQCFWELGSLEV
jgi:hypothetical protein